MHLDKLKTTADIDVAGKRVLVRADLNVPVKDGRVTDVTRLERVVPGLLDLAKRGAKVIVISHFGRPKGAPDRRVQPAAGGGQARPAAGQAGRFRRRLHRRGGAEDCGGAAARQYRRAGEPPVPQRRREERSGVCRGPGEAGRHFRQRCLFHRASRACLHRCRHAPAPVLRRPADDGGNQRAAQRAGQAQASGGCRGRRREGLDQDSRPHQPCRQGRQADHRRRHGQHVPAGAGSRHRQVTGRTGLARYRARDHARRQGAQLRDRLAGRCGHRSQVRGRRTLARLPGSRNARGSDDPGRGPKGGGTLHRCAEPLQHAALERPARRFRDRSPSAKAPSSSRVRRPRPRRPASSLRLPVAATRLQRSMRRVSRSSSATCRRQAARSSNGSRGGNCRA